MGRFYQTDKATFVDDIIYQAPHELMMAAVQAQDKNFEDTIEPLEGTEALYDNTDYQKKDSEAYQQLVKDTNDRILDLTNKVYESPAEAAKYKREINKLRSDLEYSIRAGDFHQMDKNKKAYDKLTSGIMSRKDLTEKQKTTAVNQINFEYKGFDSEENNLFPDSFHVYEKLDEETFIKNKKAEMTADSIKTTKNRTDGRYFTTESGEERFISDDKLDNLFEGSTGVGKWEKALLQRLDWENQQGLLPEEDVLDERGNVVQKGRNTIFKEERAKFKNDFIGSLGFNQTATSEVKTADGTYYKERADKRAQGKYNKEMETLASKGKVEVERDSIPIPVNPNTEEDIKNKQYNESANTVKNGIRQELLESLKYTSSTEEGPVVDKEALENDVREKEKEVQSIFSLPLGERRLQTKELIAKYGKDVITDYANLLENKDETYNRELLTEEQKKTFKKRTYATLPPSTTMQVTFPNGEVKNMTRTEFEKAAETLIPTKKTSTVELTKVGEDGKIYAARESDGELYIITEDDAEGNPVPVLNKDYKENKSYTSGYKRGTKKVKEIVGVPEPFDINKMMLSVTEKKKYENALKTPTTEQKLNIHVVTSEGPMIARINKIGEDTFTQIK